MERLIDLKHTGDSLTLRTFIDDGTFSAIKRQEIKALDVVVKWLDDGTHHEKLPDPKKNRAPESEGREL